MSSPKTEAAFSRWAPGYGRIRHTRVTGARVRALVQRLDRLGLRGDGAAALDVLAAADRVASAAMWLVVHETYAHAVYQCPQPEGGLAVARKLGRGMRDRASGRIEELEGRLWKLEGQLKILQGQARRARGEARDRLVRLEGQAASRVSRVKNALTDAKTRVAEAVEGSRQRVERLMRAVEPAFQRTLAEARKVRRSAEEARSRARDVKAGIDAGIRAGRQEYRRRAGRSRD